MNLTAHPLAESYRKLTETEYQCLKDSMAHAGQLHPIYMVGDQILDGRHRLLICSELGIEPVFIQYTGDAPEALIKGLNDARRHETPADREERIKRAVESVTSKSGDNQHTQKQGVTGVTPSKTTQQAADEAGVSKRTLQRRKARAKEGGTRIGNIAKKLVADADATGGILPTAAEVAKEHALHERQASFAVDQARTAMEVREQAVGSSEPPAVTIDQEQLIEARAKVLAREMAKDIAAKMVDDLKAQIYRDVYEEHDNKIRFAENYRHVFNLKHNALTPDEYNLFFKCLHPDVIARFGDDELTDRFTRAFRVLKEKKTRLMLPPEFKDKAPPRPQTFEEYMAEQKARKAASSKKAAATRKAKKAAKEGATA